MIVRGLRPGEGARASRPGAPGVLRGHDVGRVLKLPGVARAHEDVRVVGHLVQLGTSGEDPVLQRLQPQIHQLGGGVVLAHAAQVRLDFAHVRGHRLHALDQQRHLVCRRLVLRLPAREEPVQQRDEKLAHRQGEDGGLKGGRHAQPEGAADRQTKSHSNEALTTSPLTEGVGALATCGCTMMEPLSGQAVQEKPDMDKSDLEKLLGPEAQEKRLREVERLLNPKLGFDE